MNDLKRILLGYDGDIDYALRRLERLEKVAEAARSVLSELFVAEHITCFVMGVELIDRLAALESSDA